VTGALKRSVMQLLAGDDGRPIAVTLKDGAGRYVGELVSIEYGTVTLAVEGSVDFSGLLTCFVDQILSVELLSAPVA
jgi:hypothetical protein